MIINTLKKLKATGLKHRTLYATSYTLKKIAEHADLLKPEEVKTYITNCNVSNSYKNNLLALEREP